MQRVKNLIIGAGITGLTFAAFCNEDYLIIEKESRPGGLCKTFYQDGFVWDFAGHFFHFAHEELERLFERRVDRSELVICKKNSKIYYQDTLIDYPFQMNIHQLEKEEFIDCLYDLFHREETKETDFLTMLYNKFGKSITDKFLKPYNEKLYACNLNSLDKNAMGRFFPFADPKQIIDNMKSANTQTYNDTFEYPKHGAEVFINALLTEIDRNRIWCNKELENIEIDSHIAVVAGEKIQYERLISTIPLTHFAEILPDSFNINETILHANKVLVFNLGFDKKSHIESEHWIYFPDKNLNFYRVGFYDNILGGDRLSLYVEIGYNSDDVIDISKQLKETLDNLVKCGIIEDHKLVSYNFVIIDPAYVHITTESIDEVKRIKEELAKHNTYSIGRYGSWVYCSMEDSMKEALGLLNSH